MDELIDLLKKRQKRCNKKEKSEFIQFLKAQLTINGYDCEILKSRFLQSQNVATGTADHTKVIFLAHYDTSTILPIWIEWIIRVFGHTRNTLTLLLFLLIFNIFAWAGNELVFDVIKVLVAGSVLIPMMLIANKNTMNDNTSGVLVLLLLAKRIANSEELKSKVKFVFTDNEEKMLTGSFQLRRTWRKRGFDYGNRIISVDSVGQGENLIITYNFVSHLAKELTAFFNERGSAARKINMFGMPFSDAYNFGKTGAVNLNMMNKSIIPGGYYIKNIHSGRDKAIDYENISMLVDTLEEYIKCVCQQEI